MFGECTETVSILYALVFGAGDACIMLSTWTILSAFAAFMVVVIIAQYFARKLWRGITAGSPPSEPKARPTGTIGAPLRDDNTNDDTPIRKSRW